MDRVAMDAPASHATTYDIHLAFDAPVLPEGQILTALSLLFTLVSLTAIRPAVVAKESQNRCQQTQVFWGIQDTRAVVGRVFSYPISPFAFQGEITHYKVILTNGSALPKWLEYNPNTNTLQGLPMLEESGEYHFTVVAYGLACGQKAPTASTNFALHIQDSILIHETEVGPNQKHGVICSEALCAREVSVTFVEIIIHAPSFLEIQERLYLIYTMAEYLHLDPSSLRLTPFKASFNKYVWNLTILAEDIRYINTTKSHYVGLYWPVGFGVFAMLYELVQVLQHNVESNNLSQLLGYEIAGWRILKKEGNEKKHSGKRYRRQFMATPRPALRPSKTEAFTVLSATLSYTQSIVRPSKSSSPLYQDTRTAIPIYTGTFLHSAVNQKLLNDLNETSASTFFQYLSSDLSPSLIATSTEFEDKVASKTPPISEQQHSQVPQDMYSTPKESEPKHSSIQYYLGFSVPTSKTLFSRPVHHIMASYVSPEVIHSKRSSLVHFSGEITSLVYSGPYAQLAASGLLSGDAISRSTLMNLTESSGFPFSSVDKSLLLSDDYQNEDLLSIYKYVSGSFMSSPLPIQTEVPTWNTSFNSIGTLSTFSSTTITSASARKHGLPPDISPPDQLYYNDNTLALATYNTPEFKISLFVNSLEFGLLSRRRSIPAMVPSLSLTLPMELTTVPFGLRSILPMEELLSARRELSPEVINIYEHAPESFLTISQTYRLSATEDKTSPLTMTHMDTALGEKQSRSIDVTKYSATILSSSFLGEEDLYSYEASLLTQPIEFSGIPKSCFSTNEFCSYDSSVIRTQMGYPNVLLDVSDLSLDSSFGTKTNFQITRQLTTKLTEESTVTSYKEIPPEKGFYATTSYHRAQDTDILTFTSYESPHGSGAIQTPLFPLSQIMFIGQTNTSPRVVNAIKWITATIGHRFSFTVPPDTFYDQEDGNTTQLTLGINPVDGSPTGLESWLQFNSTYQTVYGYPLDNDFQYSPQEFLLFATDSGGLRTSDTLTIEILRPTTIPCHIYTIRTKSSYHSFLRDRERVNLFFDKLSKYLTAGSPGNMTLLHLKPGSTVIAWYSKSFCTRTKCAIHEIQGVLLKLGVPGGKVNPDFAEAMLPDYKIVRIEDVTYGGNCLPTARPMNESLTLNRTLATIKDSHSWIKNIFSALLISICTTVMVILIVAFHYCKYHKKLFGSQSASFHRKPFFSYVDLEMNMLKSRKSPILEQEVAPTAQLWFPVPTSSQLYRCRSNRSLVTSRLPPPPKYRLPPSYGMEKPCQTHDYLKS